MSPRPWKAAVLRAASCSLLFIGLYGLCNAAASGRPEVPTIVARWERGIPFVPAMILPYWSLDLFFVASFFLLRDRRELDRLAARITAAVLGASVCFLLFPLRMGFARPDVSGPLGALFQSLRSFDAPYNQFPSLHIALLLIVGDVFLRRTRGSLRVLLSGWFLLIAASTLMTWQHHAIDVAGGLVLGLLCLGIDRSVGARYALGSLLFLGLALLLQPWGLALLWPAASLAVVSAGYAGLGAAVYRTGLLVEPCRLGHRLSLLYYRRQCRPWDEAAPGVWIGRRLDDVEAAEALRLGVTAVVDLSPELSEAAPFRKLPRLFLPVLDLTAPSEEQIRGALRFIDEHAAAGVVYVHCKVGYSRSAAVVGAWLLSSGRVSSVDEAVARLRRIRPSIVVRPEAREAISAPASGAGAGR